MRNPKGIIAAPTQEWLALKKLARKQAEEQNAYSQEASQGENKGRKADPNSQKENALAQPHKSKGRWRWKGKNSQRRIETQHYHAKIFPFARECDEASQ